MSDERLLVDQLRQYLTQNIDLHGRRIINAGTAVDGKDYVTKAELEAATVEKSQAPTIQVPAFTVSNLSEDFSYDANATSTEELADVLGTLLKYLKLKNVI